MQTAADGLASVVARLDVSLLKSARFRPDRHPSQPCHEYAASHRFPPHRRQGRLVAAGRSRGRRAARRLARRARRRHRRTCRRRARRPGGVVGRDRARPRACSKLPAGTLKLEDSQAAAAVGQIALARTWAEALGRHGITAGQILLTLGDTEERRRYLNARSTIGQAARAGARAGDQRERHGRDQRDPLRRQRPARRRASPPWRAPICWCCSPTSTASTTRRRRGARREAGRRWSSASRRRSRPWPAPPARTCRAAA